MASNYFVVDGEEERQYAVETLEDGSYKVTSPDGASFVVDAYEPEAGRMHLIYNGEAHDVGVRHGDDGVVVEIKAERHVIDVLNRVRGPFNLSEAQLAAAEAAVRDRDYADRCRAENARMRAWLAKALAEIGVPSDTSCANFILARFADRDEAEACDDWLRRQGLLVRRVAGYKLPWVNPRADY